MTKQNTSLSLTANNYYTVDALNSKQALFLFLSEKNTKTSKMKTILFINLISSICYLIFVQLCCVHSVLHTENTISPEFISNNCTKPL